MKGRRASFISKKTLTLVTMAYNLRTALAEKDICGGLEVVIVAPDTPFQEKWMVDGHADVREGDAYIDFVAGTIGIGLQRKDRSEYVTVDGVFGPKRNMELKPKVILARALNVNINLSDHNTSQPRRSVKTVILRKILNVVYNIAL